MKTLTAHVQSADAKAQQQAAAAPKEPKLKRIGNSHEKAGDLDWDASSSNSDDDVGDDGGMPTLVVKKESEIVGEASKAKDAPPPSLRLGVDFRKAR